MPPTTSDAQTTTPTSSTPAPKPLAKSPQTSQAQARLGLLIATFFSAITYISTISTLEISYTKHSYLTTYNACRLLPPRPREVEPEFTDILPGVIALLSFFCVVIALAVFADGIYAIGYKFFVDCMTAAFVLANLGVFAAVMYEGMERWWVGFCWGVVGFYVGAFKAAFWDSVNGLENGDGKVKGS